MYRHNVVYVEACSFDNPLRSFVPGTKLNQLYFRAESAIFLAIQVSRAQENSFPPPPLIADQRVPPL